MVLLYNLREITGNNGIHIYLSGYKCNCGFGFELKYWRIDGFGKKKHGSANLLTPIHPPQVGRSRWEYYNL